MEMKVVNVEFVENEMVELDVVQIGLNWGYGGVGFDCDSGECGDECGDSHAEKTSPAGIPHPNPHPSLHPLPNQSKPIVPTPLFPLITPSYNFSL